MKNKLVKTGLIVLTIIICFSCKTETPVIPATGISLSKTILFLNIGAKDTLKANVNPSNATNADINWISSDTTIAIVSSKGIVSGIIPGHAIITAVTKDKVNSSTCIVHVTKWSTIDLNSYMNIGSIHCIAFDSLGNLWVGGLSLFKFDGSKWTTYLPYTGISAIAQDIQGNLWFGTYGTGVFKFDGTNWTNYTSSNSGLVDNTINANAMAVDKRGNIWFGTSSRQTLKGTGVSRFDGTNWHAYTTTDGLAYNNVEAIATDAKGNVWFGTVYGISKFDGTNWISYTSSNTNNAVNSAYFIVSDSKGIMWFGTYPGGLLKFDGINWTTYNPSNSGISSGVVNAITVDQFDNVWIGTQIGLSKFDGTNWVNYTCNNGSFIYYIKSVAVDSHGNKWLGTGNNVIFELQE